MSSPTFLVIIPTRNRAALAMRAAECALKQHASNVDVLVSDNSTNLDDLEALRHWCASRPSDRLHYIRPPAPLPMVAHWQWALESALKLSSASHIAFCRDRTLFKRDAITELSKIVSRHPTDVVAYHEEYIRDHLKPVALHQVRWTGRLLRMDCQEQLDAAAAVTWYFYESLPRIQNCVVPRAAFLQVAQRFGSFFSSIAPDVCFAYRYLAIANSYLYLDKPMNVSYAHARSNGTNQARGLRQGDHVDFLSNLEGRPLNFAAPIPEFCTVMNAILHEYCFVRGESRSPKFSEINIANYLKFIGIEISQLEDLELRHEMEELLRKEAASRAIDTSRVSFAWPIDPLITLFEDVDKAIAFSISSPCSRTIGLAYEELNGVASLARGAQASILEYPRTLAFRARWSAAKLGRTVKRALDRHLLWRIKSSRSGRP